MKTVQCKIKNNHNFTGLDNIDLSTIFTASCDGSGYCISTDQIYKAGGVYVESDIGGYNYYYFCEESIEIISSDELELKWTGEKCPVPPETIVDVKLRCGDFKTRKAKDFRWDHVNGCHSHDIISYRVVSDNADATIIPNDLLENLVQKCKDLNVDLTFFSQGINIFDGVLEKQTSVDTVQQLYEVLEELKRSREVYKKYDWS